jgi:hypothetical protein
MLKNIILLFNVLILLLFNAIVTVDLKITPNSPSNVSPGSEFTFEIAITKGSVSGFAKIQQDLPPGFTASEIDSKGASFTFSDNKVKFIWMSLPPDQEFKITYKVVVGQEVKGTHQIAGKFSYLDNNEKKTIDIPTREITVGTAETAQNTPPPANTGTTTPPQTNTPPPTNTTATTQGGGPVTCSRTITPEGGRHKVEITVNQTGVSGFAKAQDILPAGMKAEEGGSNNAVFSFVGGKAKFVWMSLPAENQFKIHYFVTLESATAADLEKISGDFSFLENNETKKVEIPAIGTSSGTSQQTTAQNNTTGTNDNAAKEAADKAAKEAADRAAKEAADKAAKEAADKAAKEAAANNKVTKGGNNTAKLNNTPPPSNGVVYRVQVAAGHVTLSSQQFTKEFNFSEEPVMTESHEGWIKYTIGGYNQYRDARDRRNVVTSGYSFPGPFVAAYNSGTRITVQEALMITNQKWVQ